MPRKDPHTGVMVMTQAEFWNAEAEHEGKGRSGADLMHDMLDEIDADDRKEEARILQDTDEALEALKAYEGEEESIVDDIRYKDIVSIKMLAAEVHSGMRKSQMSFDAELTMSDGSTPKIRYSRADYAGSYMEPPETDEEVTRI